MDCRRWNGRDIAEALNAQAKDNPRDWPARIHHPAAFLRQRLVEIADKLAGPSPSEYRALVHRRQLLEQEERRRQQRADDARRATPTQVANHLATIRATLAARKERR